MGWSTYDQWKTDPDFGKSHRQLLDEERRQEAAEQKVGHAEELRGQIRQTLTTLRSQLGELGEMRGHGPTYEVTKPAEAFRRLGYPEDYCRDRVRTVAHDVDALWSHVDEWLTADWDKSAGLDEKTFMEDE